MEILREEDAAASCYAGSSLLLISKGKESHASLAYALDFSSRDLDHDDCIDRVSIGYGMVWSKTRPQFLGPCQPTHATLVQLCSRW